LVDFVTLICRLATPAFLLIAGLVFCKSGKVSPGEYYRKLKSRSRTLLVPYLAWNLLAVILLCAPSAFKYFLCPPGSYHVTPLTFANAAKWMVGWPMYPADAPLWFVRDLFVLIAMVPLLGFIPKRGLMIGLGALLIYWLLSPMDLIPGGVPRALSTLFFVIGVGMGMNQRWLRAITDAKWLIYPAATVLLFAAAGGATCKAFGPDYSRLGSFSEKLVRISGALLVVWAGTNARLPEWLSLRLSRLSPMSFFLFASHYLWFMCLNPLFAHLTKGHLWHGQEVLLFGLVSLTLITLSIGSHFLLRSLAPSVLSVLDGNRTARGSAGDRIEHQAKRANEKSEIALSGAPVMSGS